MLKRIMLTVIFCGAMTACSGGGGGGAKKVTKAKADAKFATGEYQTALEAYIDLIESEGPAAVVGAGWCSVRLHNYAQADSFFTSASADMTPDGNAGWSFAHWALDHPQSALDKATAVLNANGAFIFSLDTRITSSHLVWIQASSYLELGNYASCLAKIQILEPAYTLSLAGDQFVVANALLAKLQSLGVAS